jgi:hypothetical protein
LENQVTLRCHGSLVGAVGSNPRPATNYDTFMTLDL